MEMYSIHHLWLIDQVVKQGRSYNKLLYLSLDSM